MGWVEIAESDKVRAKNVNLIAWLAFHFPGELEKDKYYYRKADRHAVKIDPRKPAMWYDFGDGVGGDPISYLVRFLGMSYVDSVAALNDGLISSVDCISVAETSKERKEWIPPERFEGPYRKLFAYMIYSRHIPRDIVKMCVNKGILYEGLFEIKGQEYHNAVFLRPNFYEIRGLYDVTEPGKKNYHKSYGKEGNEYWYVGDNVRDPKAMYITEASMDALSLYVLKHEAEPQSVFCGIGGCGKNGSLHIAEQCKKYGLKCVVATDADESGDSTYEALRYKYGSMIDRLRPVGAKDWNEMLKKGIEL